MVKHKSMDKPWEDDSVDHWKTDAFAKGDMAQPLSEDMDRLIEWANSTAGAKFNGILINRYVDGTKMIHAHSDDERGLDKNAGVFCISHGAELAFCPTRSASARSGRRARARYPAAMANTAVPPTSDRWWANARHVRLRSDLRTRRGRAMKRSDGLHCPS